MYYVKSTRAAEAGGQNPYPTIRIEKRTEAEIDNLLIVLSPLFVQPSAATDVDSVKCLHRFKENFSVRTVILECVSTNKFLFCPLNGPLNGKRHFFQTDGALTRSKLDLFLICLAR